MRNEEFEKIISTLEVDHIEHPGIDVLRNKTIARCNNPQNAELLLQELEADDYHFGQSLEFHAICALCKACAHHEIGSAISDNPLLENNSLLNEASVALKSFRSCGSIFNEGLARWFVGVVHQIQGDNGNLDLTELKAAIKIFETCAQSYQIESNHPMEILCQEQVAMIHWSMSKTYQKRGLLDLFAKESDEAIKILESCLQWYEATERKYEEFGDKSLKESIHTKTAECKKQIQRIKNSIKQPLSVPAFASQQPRQQWPISQIVYSVSDFVHASRKGLFVLDDVPISKMTIDEICFDNKPHKIYYLRGGNQITLVPRQDYRWIKVAGESMNCVKPVPIEPGDYVLAALDIGPQIGDIVIANLKKPPTPDERAGVVKRYGRDGFRSESTTSIDPIPLTEANVRGVVIAVAKPARTETESHPTLLTHSMTSEEKELYKTILNMARGDKDAVKKMLNYEYVLTPNANIKEILDRAIARLESKMRIDAEKSVTRSFVELSKQQLGFLGTSAIFTNRPGLSDRLICDHLIPRAFEENATVIFPLSTSGGKFEKCLDLSETNLTTIIPKQIYKPERRTQSEDAKGIAELIKRLHERSEKEKNIRIVIIIDTLQKWSEELEVQIRYLIQEASFLDLSIWIHSPILLIPSDLLPTIGNIVIIWPSINESKLLSENLPSLDVEFDHEKRSQGLFVYNKMSDKRGWQIIEFTPQSAVRLYG